MASNNTINTRIQHKHDVESNWNRAENFIPLIGEIIVYDIDSNFTYERFKIGDGKTIVGKLPFYLEHEVSSMQEKILFLAQNTLDAVCDSGVLVITKGIQFS